ncbi:MAG: hypothetical protein GF347_03390 [Candidatus Moranbacteria bacterium]|nr:hypothetical protein [Candidatus Moranbacteria bacterium]
MYQRKINTMIALSYEAPFVISNIKKFMGEEENLTEDEKSILEANKGLGGKERHLHKIDKFIQGTASKYDTKKNKKQIGEELFWLANEIESKYIQNQGKDEEKLREKGIDPEKLAKGEVKAQEIEKIVENALNHYGWLSDEKGEDYRKTDKGPAKDGKWRVVIDKGLNSMNVDGSKKVIFLPNKNQKIRKVITVLLAHEIEGHILQNENKRKVSLEIINTIGADRANSLMETGAMMNQNRISEEVFGIKSIPHLHYVRTMEARLEGKNYLECVKAFYDSAMKTAKAIHNGNLEKLEKESSEWLKMAISRTKRLFRASVDLASKEPYLAQSKATSYLEKERVFELLQKKDLTKYAYLGGVNLETIKDLLELGLLTMDDIEEPKDYAIKYWNEIKQNYSLEV